MKITKTKIILISALIVIGVIVFFVWPNKNKKQTGNFVDLENSVVTENEGSVNTVNIADREMVQVKFSYEVNGIKYNDALNILKSEYAKLSAEDIENMKVERFKNWVETVNAGSKQTNESR